MSKSLRLMVMAGIAALVLMFAGPIAKAQAPATAADESSKATPAATPAAPASAPAAAAGDQQGQGRGGRRGDRRGGGMRMDPAQRQQMMLEGVKSQLNPTDEEWTVIQPLLGDVMKLQMDQMRSRYGRMGRMGRRGPGQGPAGAAGGPENAPGAAGPGGPGAMGGPQGSPEATALETAIETEGTANKDVKAKLDAYRASQKKNEQELKAAREKLRKVLTVKQEARLVLMGVLD